MRLPVELHTRIVDRVALCDSERTVRTAVIHKDNLQLFGGLRKQTIQTGAQIAFGIVYGNDESGHYRMRMPVIVKVCPSISMYNCPFRRTLRAGAVVETSSRFSPCCCLPKLSPTNTASWSEYL